jgi:hypothetical protein
MVVFAASIEKSRKQRTSVFRSTPFIFRLFPFGQFRSHQLKEQHCLATKIPRVAPKANIPADSPKSDFDG